MPSKKSPVNRKLAKTSGRCVSSATRRKRSPGTLGMDRSYVGAIERGEFNITLDTMVKIADGLGTTVSALCMQANL
jgi:transcriptional regulator with XRE-family HTH domain